MLSLHKLPAVVGVIVFAQLFTGGCSLVFESSAESLDGDVDTNLFDATSALDAPRLDAPGPDAPTLDAGFALVIPIAGPNDDATLFPDHAAVDFTLDDLDLGSSHSAGVFDRRTIVILEFKDVQLAQNTPITEAYIQFAAQEQYAGTVALDIALENSSTPNPISASNFNKLVERSAATLTPHSWDISAQWDVGDQGPEQQTPSLKDSLQILVNQSEWKPGASIVVFISGREGNMGTRPAYSFDGMSSVDHVPRLMVR